MKEEFKEWLAMVWQEDRGQCLGLFVGIVLALMILLIGFWRTAFIVLCGGVGLYIGRKADRLLRQDCRCVPRPHQPAALTARSASGTETSGQ